MTIALQYHSKSISMKFHNFIQSAKVHSCLPLKIELQEFCLGTYLTITIDLLPKPLGL